MRENYGEGVRDTISGGRKSISIILLESSQAFPACPSGRKNESKDVTVVRSSSLRQRAEF
jgi:hypothetical protein